MIRALALGVLLFVVPVSDAPPEPEKVTIRYSMYYPAWGGPNCANFVDGECISRMASGYRWQDYIGVAAACPPSWPFGTKVFLNGEERICLDRGGKVKYVRGIPWVDFLDKKPDYDYRTLVQVTVVRPHTNHAHAPPQCDTSDNKPCWN